MPPTEPETSDVPADEAAGRSEGAKGEPPLVVVGIGASAGGVDALQRLIAAIPADSRLAIVVVQHLAPDTHSMMVELLARHTRLRVVEAADELLLQPGQVAVAPPGVYLRLTGHRLHLVEISGERAPHLPIDFFLRSLAAAKKEAAIAVILSGAGADGSIGVREIKEAGGLTIAQEGALYDAMPRNAIDTGLVDHVVPLEQIPPLLLAFAGHSYVAGGGTSYSQDDVLRILSLVQAATKRNFKPYKKKTVMRRIERRMGMHGITALGDYLTLLHENPAELRDLAKDLLIGVTTFFRDPDSFDVLAREVIAPMVAKVEANHPLRVWVAGCATGEEAYTVAMLMIEAFAAAGKACAAQIFATDIDADALNVARQGVYPESIEADVSPERLARFFVREGNTYRVTKQLREAVMFAAQNLLADPPFSKIDLITCRNLLIYIEPGAQKNVIGLFRFVLNDGGVLMLGSSETLGRLHHAFEPVSTKARIYRRVGPARAPQVTFPLMREGTVPPLPPAVGRGQPTRESNAAEITRKALLDLYAPASVLVNRRGQVLYFFGPTSRYLEFPTGEPSEDLIAIARDTIRPKLRAMFHHAVQTGEAVIVKGLRIAPPGGGQPAVRVSITPVRQPRAGEGLLLVSFFEEPEVEHVAAGGPAERDESLVQHLENELQSTREDLQTTIEELETSNEELKASNEEIMSINEELQSSNEELETSKEELQSLNEELNTVNSQLHDKVDELQMATDDLANLLSSTDIATLFLDNDLRIKRYTPAVLRLFNLIASDIGRPISDISQKFEDPQLLADVGQVLDTLIPVTREIPTEGGGWSIRRVLPYRTQDNHIAGVVITFTDVSRLKLARDQLADKARRQELLLTIGQSALGGADLGALEGLALRAVAEALSADRVCLFAPVGTSRGPALTLARHNLDAPTPNLELPADGTTDVGLVYRSGRGVVLPAPAAGAPARCALAEDDPALVSACLVTIDGADGPTGVLAAYARRPDAFDDDDLQFLRSVAHVVSLAAERKLSEDAVQGGRDFAEGIVDAVREPLLVIDREHRVVTASRSFLSTFQVRQADIDGSPVQEMAGGAWNREQLRQALKRVMATGEPLDDFEVDGDFPTVGRRTMLLNARRIDRGGRGRVLIAMEDVTDRKRTQAALANAKVRAEEANAAKTRFLAAASHDLRQPAQAAHLFVSALQGRNRDPNLSPAIQHLSSSLESMAHLLDALLDVSRLDAGMIVPKFRTVTVDEALKDLVGDWQALAAAKKLAFRYVSSKAEVSTDPILLGQIVRNLVANAIRYTERGKILLGCRRRRGQIELSVYDTGPGIAPEHLDRIFSEFYQIGNEARQISRGLGLGLSIVDRVAHLLDAQVAVRSTPGKGSQFIVRIPTPTRPPGGRPRQDRTAST